MVIQTAGGFDSIFWSLLNETLRSRDNQLILGSSHSIMIAFECCWNCLYGIRVLMEEEVPAVASPAMTLLQLSVWPTSAFVGAVIVLRDVDTFSLHARGNGTWLRSLGVVTHGDLNLTRHLSDYLIPEGSFPLWNCQEAGLARRSL